MKKHTISDSYFFDQKHQRRILIHYVMIQLMKRKWKTIFQTILMTLYRESHPLSEKTSLFKENYKIL